MKTIGIIGIGRGTGVTHLAVWMANYLTGVKGERTAVLEWNEHGDFHRMRHLTAGKDGKKKPYRMLKVDYYEQSGPAELAGCMGGTYGRIILDLGEHTGDRIYECARCDKKIIVGALSEWQAETFLEFLKEEDRRDKSWSYAAAFGSEETRREVERAFGRKLYRIPVSVDAFAVTRTDMDFFATLLGDS